MKRSIQKLLEDPISDELIQDKLKPGSKIEAVLEYDAEFPKEKVYTDEKVTPETKEADKKQALLKAKVAFNVIGTYSEQEQEELKRSTIKTRNKVLSISSTSSGSTGGGGASGGGGSSPKEPIGNKTA